MTVRHASLQSTLESAERRNRQAIRKYADFPEAESGMGATLVTPWTLRPATIIRVEPRRLFVQEDFVAHEPNGEYTFHRNTRAPLHFFRRVLGTKKWTYASDWRIRGQRTLGVIIGERKLDEPEIPAERLPE